MMDLHRSGAAVWACSPSSYFSPASFVVPRDSSLEICGKQCPRGTRNGRAPKADFEAELQEMLTELVRDAKAVSPEVRADLVMQVG